VFDVAALAGLTAEQITVKLGKPVSDAQESDNEQMKSVLYQRGGYKLSIDYEVQSRRLLDIYFTPVKSWQKYWSLLSAANVKLNDKRYKVEPLNEENGLYAGIAITPADARVLDRFGKYVPGKQAQED